MGLEFANPWFLLLLPPALALVWWGWKAPTRRLVAAQAAARESQRYVASLQVRRPPVQHTVASAVRALVLTLLILALAGTAFRFTSTRQTVAFAVDVSASLEGKEGAVTDFLRLAIGSRGQEDQAAVVAVGETAMVDLPLGEGLAPGPVASHPGFDYTNLAEGLRLAGGILPEGSRRRVVLVSDGHQNIGNAVEQARALAAQGIRVDVVPVEARRGPDVMVTEVRVPPYAFTGEEVPVSAALRATSDTRAKVRLYAGKTQVSEQEVVLQPGLNQVSFKVPAGSRGFQTYRVEVEAAGDSRVQNNSGAGITRISGTPSVLVVRTDPEDGLAVRGALQALGVGVVERTPEAMPGSVEDLQAYAAVILANVPAHMLREQTMDHLEAYVRDTGGGLMMIGGEESYGLGAYHGTPVERALPVYMDIKGRGEIPSLGLALVIDKSGSMGFLPRFGAPVKMELAKEAAIRTVEIMNEQDLFGVVAFDGAAGWVVDLGPVDNKLAIQQSIGRIFPGGGTNIYPGVEMAYQALRGALVKMKHIILLTDGVSAFGGNYEQLSKQMREAGITLSAVAVGNDADIFLLQQLARWGRGRFYYTEDGDSVPTIFAKETVLATRSYILEQSFTPAVSAPSPVLRGLNGLPSLNGYVATRPKEAAEVALISPEQDPVLATWQYGLGRAIAWTPDLKGRWAGPWIGTPELQQLLSNAISWMMRPDDRGEVQVTAKAEAGRATIQVDAAPGAEGEATQVRVTTPDLQSESAELKAVAPGQYLAELPARAPGAYLVQVEQRKADGTTTSSGAGFVVPYSPEYSVVGVNWQTLQQIAAAGGGQVLTDPAQAFADNLAPVRGKVELWRWLLGAVALLWPFDIALRRLVIRPAAVQAWALAMLARLRRSRTEYRAALGSVMQERRERQRLAQKAMASLEQEEGALPLREAAGAERGAPPAGAVAPAGSGPGARSGAGTGPPAISVVRPSGPPKPQPRAPAKAEAPASAPASGGHAARLLAGKRRRQEERESEGAGE